MALRLMDSTILYIPRLIKQNLFCFDSYFYWFIDYKRIISAYRLKKYKDKFKGKRCFIIGNGTSLNSMDLNPLKSEYTFGLNRIYLLFEKLDFTTTFYVAVNKLVIDQCSNEINALEIPKFISWYGRNKLKFNKNIYYIRDDYNFNTQFSLNPGVRIWEGSTVTYVAMQLAYYMGFTKVILIGVDHYFETKGKPHKVVISEGDDPNHFDPNYFGRGFRWQLPDLENSERSYLIAKKIFEKSNREIFDATVKGKLDLFQKVDYYSLF